MPISIDWAQVLESCTRIVVAFLLALPLAIERNWGGRGIGLRTFPIVAMAACGYVLLVKGAADTDVQAQSRLLQGLIAGIGFIGGGAIVKEGFGGVRGLVTAASIWNTSAIGA